MNRFHISIICCLCVALAMVGTSLPAAAYPAGQDAGSVEATASAYVKRAVFTSGVEEREPLDRLDRLTTASTRVFFFTEIVDLSGHTVTHRWVYEGETMAEVVFAIGGPRWRVYSSKTLIPEWTGTWTVEVVDEQGSVLHEGTLEYAPSSP